VLTASRAYVERFDVLRQWQEGGVHHAKIKAIVKVGELAANLQKHGVAVRDMPGQKTAMQATHEIESDADAAEMLLKAAQECAMDRMMKAVLTEEPETVDRDAVYVTLRIRCLLESDIGAWKQVQPRVTSVLKRVALKSGGFLVKTDERDEHWFGFSVPDKHIATLAKIMTGKERRSLFDIRGEQGTTIVHLVRPHFPSGVLHWDSYLVNSEVIQPAVNEFSRQNFCLRLLLLDRSDAVQFEHEHQLPPVLTYWSEQGPAYMIRNHMRFVYISPFVLSRAGNFGNGHGDKYAFSFPVNFEITVPLEDLKKVNRVSVAIAPKK